MAELKWLECLQYLSNPGRGGYKITWQMLEILLKNPADNPLVTIKDVSHRTLPKPRGGGYMSAWKKITRIMIEEKVEFSLKKSEKVVNYFIKSGMEIDAERLEWILRGLFIYTIYFMPNRFKEKNQKKIRELTWELHKLKSG